MGVGVRVRGFGYQSGFKQSLSKLTATAIATPKPVKFHIVVAVFKEKKIKKLLIFIRIGLLTKKSHSEVTSPK